MNWFNMYCVFNMSLYGPNVLTIISHSTTWLFIWTSCCKTLSHESLDRTVLELSSWSLTSELSLTLRENSRWSSERTFDDPPRVLFMTWESLAIKATFKCDPADTDSHPADWTVLLVCRSQGQIVPADTWTLETVLWTSHTGEYWRWC